MDPYSYVLKQWNRDRSSLWTSEVHRGDMRAVRQTVIAGYLQGEPRWAETETGHFIFGVNALGKECPGGGEDFSDV